MAETLTHYDIEEEIRELAASSPPGTFYMRLRERTMELLSDGRTREELLDIYEHVAAILRDENEELEEDVLEVMTELEGWCAPHARL